MSKIKIGHSPGNKSIPKRQLDHQLSYAQHHNTLAAGQRRTSLNTLNVNFLRPQKNIIDIIDAESGVTSLIQACEDNSLSEVKALLEKGAAVNAADTDGRSPLMVASAEGNVEIVIILLEHHAVIGEKNIKNQKRKNSENEDSDTDTDSVEGHQSASLMEKISPRKLTPDHHHIKDKKSIDRDNNDSNNLTTGIEMKDNVTITGGTGSGSQAEIPSPKEEESNMDEVKEGGEKEGAHTDNGTLSPSRMPALLSQKGVTNLLKEKPDIDIEAKDKYGWTALMYAALCGQDSTVKILLDKKANIHAINIKQRTALHIAIMHNKLHVATILLQNGAPINGLDFQEWTPAMCASKRGDIEAVSFAITHGAFLSVNKETLLTIAAEYGHLELVKNLLERKVKPSLGLRDIENEMVLFRAAEHKHILLVQFMLDYGVNINAVNEMEQNALIIASSKGHEEIINFLLQKHADIFHEDEYGFTAYLYAAKNNLIQVIKLLIGKGVHTNSASSKSGIQALMCASKAGHFKLVGLFLEYYAASIDATDHTKKTAFHYSCIGGHVAIADLLIAKGAHYRKDIFSRTPLYYARNNGHFEVAAALEHKYGDKKILMRADLQPVSNAFDIIFLTVTASACYADIVFDVINAYTFYENKQFKYFSLALFFQVIPLLAAVSLQKGWGTKLMAILHLSVIREFYHSIRGKVETPMMCTLRIIETCLEACPSALLQLYVLIHAWLLNDTAGHGAKGFYGFLPTSQEQLLFLSIIISIGSTSITFIKFVSSEKDRLLMPIKSLVNCFINVEPEKLSNIEGVYCYHCCEEFFRLLTLAVLFVALKEYALIAIAGSLLLRLIFSTVIHKAENFAECTKIRHFTKIFLRITLSQITDCLWYNHFHLTLHLQILTTLEGLACSMALLYVKDIEQFSFARIKILLVIGGMTWVLKTSLYLITYFWMCSDPVNVLIVDENDYGLYYNSSRQRAQRGKVTPIGNEALGPLHVKGGEENANDPQEKEVEAYENHALNDRKNYFRSIMKAVKKTTSTKFQYNYGAFPLIPHNEIELLKAVRISVLATVTVILSYIYDCLCTRGLILTC